MPFIWGALKTHKRREGASGSFLTTASSFFAWAFLFLDFFS